MSQVLNRKLYNALYRAFGDVRVSNEGQRYVPCKQVNVLRGGRIETPPIDSGEYYHVSCPFCNDTLDRCDQCTSSADCPNDLFGCNGTEACNLSTGSCAHSGYPCTGALTTCIEDGDGFYYCCSIRFGDC